MKALTTKHGENFEIEVYKDGKLSPEFVKAIHDFSNNVVTGITIPAQQIIDFPKGEQVIQRMVQDDECDNKQDIYEYPNCYFELRYVGLPYAKKGVIGMVMGFGEQGNEDAWVDVSDWTQLLDVLKREYTTAWQNKYDDMFADIEQMDYKIDAFNLGE